MNKTNTVCRVCGKKYYCCGAGKAANAWKSVACSKECYSEYLRKIKESRTPGKL